MQARGENLFSVLKAFTNSSNLKNSYERESIAAGADGYNDERAVFFDYLTLFMVSLISLYWSITVFVS